MSVSTSHTGFQQKTKADRRGLPQQISIVGHCQLVHDVGCSHGVLVLISMLVLLIHGCMFLTTHQESTT